MNGTDPDTSSDDSGDDLPDDLFDSGTSDGADDEPGLLDSGPGTPEPTPLPAFSIAPENANGLDLQSVPKKGKVLGIDVIVSSTGAVTGFPTINGVDLNVPGPVNDTTTTGTCRLVFQIKFHLAGIPSSEVGLVRKVDRLATVTIKGVQQPSVKKGLDGPSPVTVVRPDGSTIAVSDDPGLQGEGHRDIFPISYHASFDLFAFDIVSNAILAKVSYVVDVQKASFGDTSPTTTLTGVAKTFF